MHSILSVNSVISLQMAALLPPLPTVLPLCTSMSVLSRVLKHPLLTWALVLIKTCRDPQFSSEQPTYVGISKLYQTRKSPMPIIRVLWFLGIFRKTWCCIGFNFRNSMLFGPSTKTFKLFMRAFLFNFTYIKERFSSLKCNYLYVGLLCT